MITRRQAMALGAGTLAAATQANGVPSSTFPDFTDPVTALRTHVKMVGSLGRDVIYSFMRLNLFADLGQGNFVPFFTMNNILVDYWEPKGDDQYEMRKFEVGF